ncbi:MAG: autotransporter-associated beta strand repeat-containing protein [Verrucomicrobiota bacterium]
MKMKLYATLAGVSRTVCHAGAFLALSLLATHAALVTNLDNGTSLYLGGAWAGIAIPQPTDVAVWNNLSTSATAELLGANCSWGEIQILDPQVPITISAGNTLTLNAPSGTGIDMSAASQNLILNCPVVLAANQNWNVANNMTLTNGGAIGILTLNGQGTTSLGVANTYSAGTVLNSGIVVPCNATSFGAAAALVTCNGGTIQNAVLASGGIIANPFTVSANSTLVIDMFSRASTSFVLDGPWAGPGTILVTNMVSGDTLTFGGNAGASPNFNATIIFVDNGVTAPAGTLRLNNGGTPGNCVGNPNLRVNLGGTSPGSAGSTVIFYNRDATTTSLGELTGGPGTVLEGQSSGSGTEIWSIGDANNFTFAGTIKNSSSSQVVALTKVGAGTFTLTGTNTFTGAVTISAGTLQVGDGGADGVLGGGTIQNSGSLVFNRPDTYTVTNNIQGSGTVTIQAGGTQYYGGTNSSSGTTFISPGASLILSNNTLGTTGALSCPISVATGATLDVSQVPTFTLSQTLSGSGTVTGLLAAASANISPGTSLAAGTLTFTNTTLAESGGVNHTMKLTGPSGPNDLIVINGSLNVSGANNTFTINPLGSYIPSGTYRLLTYSGTLTGFANFAAPTVTGGATGYLTNPSGEIDIVITPASRGSTNLTWVGGGLDNWDTTSYEWVNGANSFAFQSGDSVRFDQTGAANPTVNLPGFVTPASVVVSNTTAAYTFQGAGGINGSTGLIKTNSGTLTVLTTNGYTGPTIIGGGTLSVSTLGNSLTTSGIGAANSDPTNLVFFGTTLAYTGPGATTDHGATLNGSGGIFDVAGGTTLTLAGTITGPGALILTDTGTLTLPNPNTYTGGTILSNGVLALGSDLANNNGAGFSALGATTNPVTFYGGTLQLYGYNTSPGYSHNTLYNPLIVPAGQTGTLIMFPRGPANSGSAAGLQSSLTGGGTLNLEVDYVRDDLSGNWSAFTGTINASVAPLAATSGSGEMRINNNYGYTNATINLNDGVILDNGTTRTYSTNDIGALTGTSASTVGPGTTSGAYPTYRVGWNNQPATFNGTIADDTSTTIIKVGTGTWTLAGYNIYTGPTYINQGTLAINSLASYVIKIAAGATLDVTAIGGGTLTLNYGQTLGGNGTLSGSLSTSSGSILAPADPIGKLTVTGPVTLGGNIVMEVDTANGAITNDTLVAPTIALGGTLTVENVGPPLQIGDSFKLFSGTLSGSFATLDLGYYTWNTSGLLPGGNGIITVTGFLPPPTFGVTTSAGNIVLSSSGGVPGGPLSILTTTNISPPVTWTTVTNDVFAGDGTYSLTIPINTAIAQQFYALQHF